MPSSTASDRRDAGQATVELALTLPLLCLILLGTVHVGLVIRDQLDAELAAREAARAAAASADAASTGAQAGLVGLDPSRAEVSVTEHDGAVTATVHYLVRSDLPLIGSLLPDVTLTASATMAVEPPIDPP